MGFTFKYWVLKLALLKRIAVLKTLICNIFFYSVYRVNVCRLSCEFGGTVYKNEIVDGFHVKLRHAVAPHVKWNSVITNSNIYFSNFVYREQE